ncbi:MAG: aminotransferase class I/II-fold pyridoxal phosphate-dependent enzyme [Bacteroidetes bacterium]|nr:aminotransferase class I/II-fold pyridoxal phosphate-dependent enzyme [Bacteroidota bacterium]
MEPSKRLQAVEESQTLVMTKKARELSEQGISVINLSIGEPDFDTPQFIKDAAIDAINKGHTHYPPVAGYLELRKIISQKFRDQNNLEYAPDQIVVSCGAKHSIMNVIMALLNPGDEVIIPSPFWVSYPAMVKLAEAKPVFLESNIDTDYKFNIEQLENAITPKTRIVLFSSPCNPSGSVFSKEELKAIADVIARHPDIIIVSDEIYEHLQYGQNHTSIGTFENVKDRVVTVNGLSKAYAMTGWRIGYIGAPKWIAQACEKLQGQFTSGANSIAQYAAMTAIGSPLDETIKMRNEFEIRRDVLFNGLRELPSFKPNYPKGAFYIFPDVSYYFNKSYNGQKIENAEDLCFYLLADAHVSLVSGAAFGNPECVRVSYAASTRDLNEAIRRMKISLAKLA